MGFFTTLLERPWEGASEASALDAYSGPDMQDATRIALRFFLAIVGVLFFLIIITFLSRSQYPDFEALAGAPWLPFSDTSRLWFNTSLLVCASASMQLGLSGARGARLNTCVIGISMGVLFTLGFLLAQLDLWKYLQSLGFYIDSNPANSYFYLLSAVHGLHLAGGLLVLANVVFRRWRDETTASLSAPLALCATYWHFLLVVWLVLFALLTRPPASLNALAAMCGF